MVAMKILKPVRNSSGQALVETALILPIVLLLVLNIINFGFFFLVALNLTASPRSAAEYSILGFQTPGSQSLPTAVPVSYLSGQDLYGAISSPSSVSIQVCSSTLGVSGSPQTAKCAPCTLSSADMSATCSTGGTGSPAPNSDPESPTFVLARVDVDYSFSPPIPGTPFGLALLPLGVCSSSGGTVTCRFHRQVSMREMN